MKLGKEACKDTKLSFRSLICRTGIKDISDTINTTNFPLERYCKQQNLGFIGNGNINKSDLNSKGLHLHERDSIKLAKNLLDLIYRICELGSSVCYEPEVSDNCVNKVLSHFKTNHPQCVSLGYLKINLCKEQVP